MLPGDIAKAVLSLFDETDKQTPEHREIIVAAILEAVEERWGCRCERALRAATHLPNDEAEPARMLLSQVQRDLKAVGQFRGRRGPGFADGLRVIVEQSTRLFDELEYDPD